MYLLDTDTSIFLLNERKPIVEQKLRQLRREDVGISTVTMAELYYGAAHSKQKEANKKRISVFCRDLQLFPFDAIAAEIFGTTKDYLGSRGEMIGTMDLLIASVSLTHQATLVTHNIGDFQKIPGLKYEDWFESE